MQVREDLWRQPDAKRRKCDHDAERRGKEEEREGERGTSSNASRLRANPFNLAELSLLLSLSLSLLEPILQHENGVCLPPAWSLSIASSNREAGKRFLLFHHHVDLPSTAHFNISCLLQRTRETIFLLILCCIHSGRPDWLFLPARSYL